MYAITKGMGDIGTQIIKLKDIHRIAHININYTARGCKETTKRITEIHNASHLSFKLPYL